jgi:hypothetical protein
MRSEAIARLLPEIVYRTYKPRTPLAALLEVMEALQDPTERTLNELDATFNAHRAPDRFVGMLARWVDLQRYLTFPTGPDSAPGLPTLPSGHGYLRELVAAAAHLAELRGTTSGLVRFLETATGVPGFLIKEGVSPSAAEPRPFHFTVLAPPGVRPIESLVRKIIANEKPAHATFDLEFGKTANS